VDRAIVAFRQDDAGDWIAELSCLHSQHVRHRPPFFDRPWVMTTEGRAEKIGGAIDCPLCDRAELPAALRLVRTAGPFDGDTLPAGLRRSHRVAEGTWAVLRVLDGSVRFTMATVPPVERELRVGDTQPIPPLVSHALGVAGPVRLEIDFMARAG
jgi:tellurite methyltransferase